MTYQGFINTLKKRADNRLFLICGENDHFKREGLNAIFSHFNAKQDDLDVDRFDAKAKETDIIFACRTMPFMSEKRIVVAEDFEPLFASKESADVLTEYVEDISDSAVLIFYMAQKPDKRKRLYKAIEKKGLVAEFGEPSLSDITSWVVFSFANLGKTIGRPAVSALIERSGQNMTSLSGEIEKIASYVTADEVKTADVIKIASQSFEYNVYQIHDFFMSKKINEALSLLREVVETEKSPFGIMGLIAGKFRLMYKARTLMDTKRSQEDAIKLIGGHPYAAKMAMKDAKSFTAEALREGINKLAKADYRYKTGQQDAELSLEKTLMEIYGI